ncbi:MAG TPA: carboxylating nicotinate-nucleotide diphosphorylase [Oculatellaceae cyanobacterium]|jgi:nicotinate-nucleotide pyrophosphorylase (carboxylating)
MNTGVSVAVQPAMKALVEAAVLEDLAQGDITTDNLPSLAAMLRQGVFRVRQACVVSGLTVASLVCQTVDPALDFEPMVQDGDAVAAGQVIAKVSGCMASILKAERTALNFLQHLSGIATETRRYADALVGTRTRITHTRKTTPGLRLLEQQAVLHGGGMPHRFNLGSCAMLKDNHLQSLSPADGNAIAEAVCQLRARLSHTTKIEVEADTLTQVQQAVDAGADIILLDNMEPDTIREALRIIKGRAVTEASGGIAFERLREYAETGVDLISTSKITLGVPAIDIGLDLE